MTCCNHCRDAGDVFTRKKAENELRTYRRKGPSSKSTGLLIEGLKRLDLQNKALLDVGGGIGTIQHELSVDGISDSMLVEASSAYLEVAESEAHRRGYEHRTSYRYGDFVELAPEIPQVDLVTLDRVICCYPHMKRLVQASTAKADRWYGAVYPKNRWYSRLGQRVANLYFRVRGMNFRLYVHSGIDATIRQEGFTPFYQAETVLWKVALYERTTGSD